MATAKRTGYCFVVLFRRTSVTAERRRRAGRTRHAEQQGFFGAAPKNRLKTFLDEDNVAGRRPSIRNRSLIFSSHYGYVWGLLASPLGALWEPSQVFTLLETVYHAFDEIAKRRVFKVETIGDCYVLSRDYPIRERIMPSSWHASPVML
jgi:hypothetical protein